MELFEPFIKQMRWSSSEDELFENEILEKIKYNLKHPLDDALHKEDPMFFFVFKSKSSFTSLNPLQQLVGVPFFLVWFFLTVVHLVFRGGLGLLGALAEVGERYTEGWIVPWQTSAILCILTTLPKLFLYLLKQPFYWANTFISSIIHLASAGLLFGFAVLNMAGIGSPKIRRDMANMGKEIFQRGGQALVRFIIMGLLVSAVCSFFFFGGAGALAGWLGVSMATARGAAAIGSIIATSTVIGGSVIQGAVGKSAKTCCPGSTHFINQTTKKAHRITSLLPSPPETKRVSYDAKQPKNQLITILDHLAKDERLGPYKKILKEVKDNIAPLKREKLKKFLQSVEKITQEKIARDKKILEAKEKIGHLSQEKVEALINTIPTINPQKIALTTDDLFLFAIPLQCFIPPEWQLFALQSLSAAHSHGLSPIFIMKIFYSAAGSEDKSISLLANRVALAEAATGIELPGADRADRLELATHAIFIYYISYRLYQNMPTHLVNFDYQDMTDKFLEFMKIINNKGYKENKLVENYEKYITEGIKLFSEKMLLLLTKLESEKALFDTSAWLNLLPAPPPSGPPSNIQTSMLSQEEEPDDEEERLIPPLTR